MPVSSFEIATTGTLYFLTSGSTSSRRSSSPVTEFSSGRPCGGLKTGLQRPGNRAVDAKRHIDKRLNHLDHLAHQRRFSLVWVGVGVGKQRPR